MEEVVVEDAEAVVEAVEDKRTTVVNIKSGKDYDILIDRTTKWGNPFREGVHGNRENVIKMYEEYIRANDFLMDSIGELEGKVLGCWCKPKPCHGDVLIKILNERLH